MKLMVGVRGEDGARYGRYGQLWSWCGGVKILFVKFVVYGRSLVVCVVGARPLCFTVGQRCGIALMCCRGGRVLVILLAVSGELAGGVVGCVREGYVYVPVLCEYVRAGGGGG